MEEIRIYHSFWRMLLLALASLAFVVLCVPILSHPKSVFYVVVALAGIAFFGYCGLYILYAMLKERLTGRPYLIINDEAVISEGVKQTVIHFADVESFNVVKMGKQEFVSIHYKSGVELQKLGEANALDRSVRKLNRRLVNAQENISTKGTGMKAEALCHLLNERLRASRRRCPSAGRAFS